MIILEITEQEAQLILTGLAELPAKTSFDFILKFKQVCEEQIQSNREKQIELEKEEFTKN